VPALLKLGGDLLGHVDRDCKPDPLAGGDDGRVDAHDFPLQVDQRASAVAGVDGGVGLDEVVVGTGADHPPLGADDPRRHRLFQSEGTADGHDPVAHLQVIRISQLEGLKVRIPRDLEEGKVGLGVPADDLPVELLSARQFHLDLVRSLDHVVVGQDVPVPAHDEPGAHSLLLPLRGIVPEAAERAEELPEGIPLSEGVSLESFQSGVFHLLAHLDVDHAGAHALGQGAEIARHHGRSGGDKRRCGGLRLSGFSGRGHSITEAGDRACQKQGGHDDLQISSWFHGLSSLLRSWADDGPSLKPIIGIEPDGRMTGR